LFPRQDKLASSRFLHLLDEKLKSRSLVDKLLDKCDLSRNDIIYEIGPGKGVITERLAQRCRQVIAIEKDALLVDALRAKFAMTANIRLHEGDFLEYRLPRGHYKVFANIPFNITSAIVSRFTTAPVPPDDTYLIMQKEAADLDVTPTSLDFEQWLRLFDGFKRVASRQAIHAILGSEVRLRQQQAQLEKIHSTRVSRER
jgi:16S rRNA A1518/A1519 N6-dimethyltransferase RsmA/KsgA/DIM1 with predicted DNA glycosylase/AP lyase activity